MGVDTTCPTCGTSNSLAVALSARFRSVFESGKVICEIPDRVRNLLVDHPLWQFGFHDFIPAYDTDILVARIRVGLKIGEDKYRFFAVPIVSPDVLSWYTPIAYEHQKGGRHPFAGIPFPGAGDSAKLLSSSDDEIAKTIQASMNALIELVSSSISSE